MPLIHWPRSLWTQWSDIHTQSPRELAHNPNVEKYDPTAPLAPVKEDRRAEMARALDTALSIHGRPEGMA